MARCTKERVRNGKLVQILLTDTPPSSAELYCSSYGVSSVNVSLAFYKPITGTGTRGDFVNNGLSIAAEDIVWVEAQKPCSAPIFQNSYKLFMNTSHKYKYKYKCSVFGFLLLTYYSGKVISGVHCEQIFEMSRPKLVSSAISHSPVHNMLNIFLLFLF